MAPLGPLGNAFAAMKQSACETAAKALINRHIEKFGSVANLSIDFRGRTISVDLELKGESSLVSVQAGPYELSQENGGGAIRFTAFHTSREWMTAALNQYLAGRSFPVSETVRLALTSL